MRGKIRVPSVQRIFSSIHHERKKKKNKKKTERERQRSSWRRRDSDAGLQALQSIISVHVHHIQYLMYRYGDGSGGPTLDSKECHTVCVCVYMYGRVAKYITSMVNGRKHLIHCQFQLATGCSVIHIEQGGEKRRDFTFFLRFHLFFFFSIFHCCMLLHSVELDCCYSLTSPFFGKSRNSLSLLQLIPPSFFFRVEYMKQI